jgi:hypothetical protein
MYKILDSRVDGEILTTTVQYDFLEKPVEIPHFQAKSSEEVLQNIENRELSEQAKVSAQATNEIIKKDIDSVIGVASADIKTILSAKG